MRIVRAKDYNDMSRKAANILSAQVIMKQGTEQGKRPELLLFYERAFIQQG